MKMINPIDRTTWKEDKILLDKALSGEVLAVKQVIKMLSQDGFGIAWRMTSSITDAEELLQEAFIKLWEHGHQFSGESKLRTYFYTIVSRLCLDLKRKQKGIFIEDAVFDENLFESLPIDENLLENQQQIKASLEKLPVKQRFALILWAYHDNTSEEIAKILEMNKNSVDQLLYRAKQNLKIIFSGEHV
jgi:RNA polymerase sigma-70 factor (ECF subfamily)